MFSIIGIAIFDHSRYQSSVYNFFRIHTFQVIQTLIYSNRFFFVKKSKINLPKFEKLSTKISAHNPFCDHDDSHRDLTERQRKRKNTKKLNNPYFIKNIYSVKKKHKINAIKFSWILMKEKHLSFFIKLTYFELI